MENTIDNIIMATGFAICLAVICYVPAPQASDVVFCHKIGQFNGPVVGFKNACPAGWQEA